MKFQMVIIMFHRLIVILVLAVITGCSTYDKGSLERVDRSLRIISLEKTIKAFSEAVKFAYYDEIFRFQRLPAGTYIDYNSEQLSSFRIIDYENLSKLLSDDGITARVISEFQYYQIDEGKLKKTLFEQSWWYNPIRNKWFLKTPFPLFEDKLDSN